MEEEEEEELLSADEYIDENTIHRKPMRFKQVCEVQRVKKRRKKNWKKKVLNLCYRLFSHSSLQRKLKWRT